MSRKFFRYVQGSAIGIALLATIVFRGSRAFTIKTLSKEEDEMKRETRKTIDAIRKSMMSKLDHMKDTASDAEQDVAKVMKDFVYSLKKEQRRNERIRKIQYIAIGIGAIAAVIGLAGLLLMPKKNTLQGQKMRRDMDESIDQVANNMEDSGRYLTDKTAEAGKNFSDKTRHAVDTLKEKTADTAENISDKTRHAVNTLKEKTADTAETISNKTRHAVNTLKEKTADTYGKAKDKVEDLADDAVEAKDEVQNKTEDFANDVKKDANQVKKEWEKPL